MYLYYFEPPRSAIFFGISYNFALFVRIGIQVINTMYIVIVKKIQLCLVQKFTPK
jgi:hypothetical protein